VEVDKKWWKLSFFGVLGNKQVEVKTKLGIKQDLKVKTL
jgi:hypothetical protein